MLKLTSLVTNVLKSTNQTLCTTIREFKTRGEYFRRFGYEYNKMYKGGLLPRPDPKVDDAPLPMPKYKDLNRWSEKKATFGQNDYIDILGNGNVNPVDLIQGPKWLIGFRGNELQRLSRRMKFEGKELRARNQTKFHDINKRIKYLMWRYNHKFGGLKK